ncbi:MAG TPA: hypothetical protein VFF04_07275 [Candidatus Babeliales bacterium]|nr:hypothetical protein [Candidatus Babeliales bacterium]
MKNNKLVMLVLAFLILGGVANSLECRGFHGGARAGRARVGHAGTRRVARPGNRGHNFNRGRNWHHGRGWGYRGGWRNGVYRQYYNGRWGYWRGGVFVPCLNPFNPYCAGLPL